MSVPSGGGRGHWLMGLVAGQDFSSFIGLVGPLTIASFLVSWGCEAVFFCIPFSLFFLGYFLNLSVRGPLLALSGPCCVLGAQEF